MHLIMFEAEDRLFYKHAEAQLKKVRAYKKKVYYLSSFLGLSNTVIHNSPCNCSRKLALAINCY